MPEGKGSEFKDWFLSQEELQNLSCEQQAYKIANNCEYVFLKWKKVQPLEREIEDCKSSIRISNE